MTPATWNAQRTDAAPPPAEAGDQYVLWEHCRNGLGIARLLVREGRPPALVHTACHLAVEMACRTALSVAGGAGPLDPQVMLPLDLRLGVEPAPASSTEHLALAERAVAWVADHLRATVPGRTWGF